MFKRKNTKNKTGLQPVSRPVEKTQNFGRKVQKNVTKCMHIQAHKNLAKTVHYNNCKNNQKIILLLKQYNPGWMDGWVDENHFKDCRQESKTG